MTPKSSHPECYARELGDCRGPVSREHVVTDTLLKEVWQGAKGGEVYGLPRICATPEDPVQIGIKALTAKILCKGHNSDLSQFDAEIMKFFKAMERLVRSEHDGEPAAQNSYVNGDFIERWMLKTLYNGLFSGNFGVPFIEDFTNQLPPENGLRTIYRDEPFPPGWGLYMSGDQSRIDHHVLQVLAVGHPTGIVGLRMWLFGSLFTLVLTDEHDVFPELATATYRPKKIVTAKTRNGIVFSWAGEFTDETLELRMSETPFKDGSPRAAGEKP